MFPGSLHTSRVVRIPLGGSASSTTSTPSVTAPGETSTPFELNRAGRTRGVRLFVLFTGAITALYLVFLELTYGATSPGVRNDLFGVATLTAVWAVFILVNWFLTVGRAPRAVRHEAEMLIVRDAYGRIRRFPNPADSEVAVLQRYPAGWLASEPTELVRVTSPGGPTATYLVARDLLKA